MGLTHLPRSGRPIEEQIGRLDAASVVVVSLWVYSLSYLASCHRQCRAAQCLGHVIVKVSKLLLIQWISAGLV
jgi:hypothetical protein